MASITCSFRSAVLAKNVIAHITLPADTEPRSLTPEQRFDPNRKYPTLVLLHGMGGQYDDWLRYTQLELYAERCGLAVICPDGNNGHYTDWVCGPQYMTYLQEEFLPMMRRMFPLSDRREDTFVGGLSMGGYGAVKWALTYPQTFSHLISFSGGLDIVPRLEYYTHGAGTNGSPTAVKQLEQVFGDLDAACHGKHNLYDLLDAWDLDAWPLPRLYACCGDQDIGQPQMDRLVDQWRSRGGDAVSYHGPGRHDFYYWNPHLQRVIEEWLPLNRHNP